MRGKMKTEPNLKEIEVSKIIIPSSIHDVDYEINPYVGCVYNCIYCYARYVQDDSGHTEPWGSFIDVKINAADLIKETDNYCGKELFIGSVTDPYLPCESEYKLTRRIIEKLLPLKPKLSIQTKSDLVLRDLDLFKQFETCYVGTTITTLDDNIRLKIEDTAASVDERIKALKKIKNEGIGTYVFIGPLLPSITDWKAIIDETSEYVDYYMVELLNIEGQIWNAVRTWLEQNHPELTAEYERIYFSNIPLLKHINRFFWRYMGYSLIGFSSYRNQQYKEIKDYCEQKQTEVIFNDLYYI